MTWTQAITFHIVSDSKFSRYLDDNDLGSWGPLSSTNRGFKNDAESVDKEIKMTGARKAQVLQILLGSVATFAPVISCTYITEQATSLEQIFNRLRGHYGFRVTGGKILELAQFSLLPTESYETLWERISSFIETNLLKASSDIKHLGKEVDNDEVITPTLQNISVVLWLKAINTDLPNMIKQRFATQLRNETLYSLREEISESIQAVLAEMQDREYTVSFAKGYYQRKPSRRQGASRFQNKFPNQKQKSCCLCDVTCALPRL